jgi:hypothetical protein
MRHEGVWGSRCIDPHILPRHWLEVSGQLHVPSAVPPVPIGLEAGWAQESVWTLWRRWNSYQYRDSNSDFFAVQTEASHYTELRYPGSTRTHPKFEWRTKIIPSGDWTQNKRKKTNAVPPVCQSEHCICQSVHSLYATNDRILQTSSWNSALY